MPHWATYFVLMVLMPVTAANQGAPRARMEWRQEGDFKTEAECEKYRRKFYPHAKSECRRRDFVRAQPWPFQADQD